MSCLRELSTGRVLSSHSSTADDSETRTESDLFGPGSQYDAGSTTRSHDLVVGVDGDGYVIRAFRLAAGDRLVVEQLVGDNEGTEFEAVRIGGEEQFMDRDNNVVLLLLPGRYRLRYTGANLGYFIARAQRILPGSLGAIGAGAGRFKVVG